MQDSSSSAQGGVRGTSRPDGASEPLSIKQYFAGRHLFLTGTTGLLGKVVLEKILRCLPDIGSICLMIRPRPDTSGVMRSAAERFHSEVRTNALFDRLRAEQGPGFDQLLAAKLRFVDGDLLQPRLGLSDTEWSRLGNTLGLIIHSAATVDLFERLDMAVTLNITGPLQILDLARTSGAALVQVSTAYVSGCRTGTVPEAVVDPVEAIQALSPTGNGPERFDVEQEVDVLRKCCRETCDAARAHAVSMEWVIDGNEHRNYEQRQLVQVGLARARELGWMDTYTYTKFLGEQMLDAHRGNTPVAIVRPAIIESTLREPVPGWLQSFRMADPVIMSYGKGRLFDFPGDPQAPLDLVPVDLVANGILAAAAHLNCTPNELAVVHIASSARNPLTLAHLHRIKKRYFRHTPMQSRQGEAIPVPDWDYLDADTFFERYERLVGKPLAERMSTLEQAGASRAEKRPVRAELMEYRKIRELADHYAPYTTTRQRFADNLAQQINTRLVDDERDTFSFDVSSFAWEQYLCEVHIPGVKRNILRLEY